MSNIASEKFKPVKAPEQSTQFFPEPNQSSSDDRDTRISRRLRLLIVDQNTQVRRACCEIAENFEFLVTETESTEVARKILRREEIALLLLDVTHPENGSQSLLQELKTLSHETPCIAMSARATIEDAVGMMRIGACDYLSKPFPLNVLTESLERAAKRWHFGMERRQLQETLRPGAGMIDALGQSIEMEKLYRILSNVADSTHPVMILGENGTGKKLVAHSIHSNGPHSARPFVSLDCASLGPELIERTLFGDPTSSPGEADLQTCGLLASTQGGTIFLDEIGNLTLELQGRFMRALREKEIGRAHGAKAVHISVRILAATSRDLTQMVREGLFRMDLYRLLSVVNLRIPPLRGRPDDIAFLAKRFLEKIQRQTGLARTLSDETLRILETYDWPDNVWELEQTVARAYSQLSGPELEPVHLPQKLLRFQRNAKTGLEPVSSVNSEPNKFPRKQNILPMAKVEEHAILEAMRATNGDKRKAAELLDIGKTTLYRKLKEYGLSDGSDAAVALPASTTVTIEATDAPGITSCALVTS